MHTIARRTSNNTERVVLSHTYESTSTVRKSWLSTRLHLPRLEISPCPPQLGEIPEIGSMFLTLSDIPDIDASTRGSYDWFICHLDGMGMSLQKLHPGKRLLRTKITLLGQIVIQSASLLATYVTHGRVIALLCYSLPDLYNAQTHLASSEALSFFRSVNPS
ncbi:hypothetical protein BJY04DRAFT_34833 [Aspergillus karnatakaensis]|uniref:uncharacterized protein n=1 Tax=Aspergillus karnatakaensis TaxID=1810916 RepID=UPI003CCD4BD3